MTTTCQKHPWCVEDDNTLGSATEPDTAHAGAAVLLPVPPHMEWADDDPGHLLKVQLWATDRHYATPRAYLDSEGEDCEVSMNADQLGEFIGQLDTFREALAGMRQQLLQATAVES